MPRVVLSTFLATAAEGDRLAFEPYHIAADMPRGPDGATPEAARAAVAEGRRRQDRLALEGLDGILRAVRKTRHEPAVAALLVNRAGWIGDLLQYSLSAAEHPAVAEGLAVRDAVRFALRTRAIDLVELDEKSLIERAAAELRLSAHDIDARLRDARESVGAPWRKEQKLACLSAWIALERSAGHGRAHSPA
ncbi:MAG TPA: hypothetical protein VFB22_05305 [Candidatus Baltobacteraceae bacterium]|nr:hypothetical protein [Candidatus Baltobacteraceae bacterium]